MKNPSIFLPPIRLDARRSFGRSPFPFELFSRSIFSLVMLAILAGTAPAQEVKWRNDYNKARREAQEKGLPLLLDFTTDNCFWCKRLEGTTFLDPTVARVMAEQFIPLKVDAAKNPTLVEILHVQSFPTVLLAAPDGKILATLEGYVEAPRFRDHLQRALTGLQNPEWMLRDFQEAGRAMAASDYARAVALLQSIGKDGKDRRIQVRARKLLADLEQQAAGRLARARQLEDKGQTTEALDALTDLLRAYAGTHAATEGGQMLTVLTAKPGIKEQQRNRRARELLAQAREDYRTQQYLGCLDRCEILASTYADLPEGIEATQLLGEIKNNPEWVRQACETLTDRLGGLYLAMAETWLNKGQPQQAVLCLERVIQTFPGTHQAEAAQTRLGQLNGQPTRPADFKKP